jgi:hypothetical protein
MAKGSLELKIKRRAIPPLYLLPPSKQFELFEESLKEALSSLNRKKTTNRALEEAFKRKGNKQLRLLRQFFKKLDSEPLYKRKLAYNAFFRVFQRLQWALNSGSEKEIELKVWITSSLDYLCLFKESLKE